MSEDGLSRFQRRHRARRAYREFARNWDRVRADQRLLGPLQKNDVRLGRKPSYGQFLKLIKGAGDPYEVLAGSSPQEFLELARTPPLGAPEAAAGRLDWRGRDTDDRPYRRPIDINVDEHRDSFGEVEYGAMSIPMTAAKDED